MSAVRFTWASAGHRGVDAARIKARDQVAAMIEGRESGYAVSERVFPDSGDGMIRGHVEATPVVEAANG